jgi:hypothetical protein
MRNPLEVNTDLLGEKSASNSPNSPEYGVSAWALTPYSGGLNHCQNCTSASEDGLK